MQGYEYSFRGIAIKVAQVLQKPNNEQRGAGLLLDGTRTTSQQQGTGTAQLVEVQ